MAFAWRPVTQLVTKSIERDFTQVKEAVDTLTSNLGVVAYSWSYFPISDKMKLQHLNELQDALDYTNTQNTCSSENASNNGTDDGADDSTVDSGQKATDNAAHDSTVDSDEHASDNADHDSTVDTDENTGVETGENTTVDTDQHTTDDASEFGTVDTNQNTGVNTDEHNSYLNNYHSSYDSADRPGYDAYNSSDRRLKYNIRYM